MPLQTQYLHTLFWLFFTDSTTTLRAPDRADPDDADDDDGDAYEPSADDLESDPEELDWWVEPDDEAVPLDDPTWIDADDDEDD